MQIDKYVMNIHKVLVNVVEIINLTCLLGVTTMKKIFAIIFTLFLFLIISTRGEDDIANSWLEKGIQLYENESYEKAQECFDKAITIDPNNADAFYNKGLAVLMEEDGDLDEALRLFIKATEINSLHYKSWSYVGAVYAMIGNPEEGLKYVDKAIEMNASWAEGYHNKGVVLYYLHKREEALDCFDTSIRLDENNEISSDSWWNKGLILEELGRNTEADEAYAKVSELQN